MSDHYFSSKPSSRSSEYIIEAELLGNRLSFKTDNGVFSKSEVDFGSRLLVETVEIQDGNSLLDMGCAYGVVGISLAKAHPLSKITMVEINERACELARENALRNQVDQHTVVYHGDGFAPIQDCAFDRILLNPPIRAGKGMIYSLFEEAGKHLYPDGSFWIVIRKQQGAESALKKLREVYSSVEVVMKKKGYWIIRADR